MPKRPIQHQLEDLSRNKLESCIPINKWLIRDKNKDYGVDCEIELFDENGYTTSVLFYVQLKATSSKNESQIYNVDFKIDTLEYFKKLDVPVLLVRYSEYLDELFVKWVSDLDLSSVKKEAKTYRVSLNINNEWIDSTPKQIEKDLENLRLLKSGRFTFPLSYSVKIDSESFQSVSKNQAKIKLRSELNRYSDFLIYEKEAINSLIKIYINRSKLSIQIGILKPYFFNIIDDKEKDNLIETLSFNILLGLSYCMIELGQADYCSKIIFENELEEQLLKKEDDLLKLLPVLLSSSYFEETLTLMNKALEFQHKNVFSILIFTQILKESDTNINKRIELIESFFKSQLEKARKINADDLIAMSHYNLGNFYKGRRRYYESIVHYVNAKRNDKNYLSRAYYYREIAGVCFELNKYMFSSKFYDKAISLGSPIEIKPLLADALMFNGEYEKASIIFKEYISEVEEPKEEFLLKEILLEGAVSNKGISEQNRNRIKASDLADVGKIESREKQLASLEKALEYDMLSGLAWYNLGHFNIEEKNYTESFYCFSMSAIINLNDIESWVNAYFSFVNSNSEEPIDLLICSLVLKTAYRHNGEEFLANLNEVVERTPNLKDDIDFLSIIEEVIVTDKKDKEETVLRIHK